MVHQLAYRRTGTPCDLPLVLIHALPLDSTMWDAVRAQLPTLDIITPDAPGFGHSPLAGSFGEPSIPTYAEAVKVTLDTLGVQRIALGGLSMGGAVAAEFVSRYPQMVAGLALMDTSIKEDDADLRAYRFSIIEQADAGHGYDAIADWETTMLSPKVSATVRNELSSLLRAAPNEGLAWQLRAMAARQGRNDAVALVEGPVYFIRGEDDATSSLEYFMELSLKAQHPRIVEIPAAGHFTANEQPEQLARALKEFYVAAGGAI
ncbi:MAG: alpha/beta hydrolase [Actinomycetaceae bacterium]|nr:alpha/beta hydrolase [Actinomycetaceae bacterium]MDY5854556.1 alpha/beta hydrolase [Arcanobacterium sp.]